MAIKPVYDRAFHLKGWWGTTSDLEAWFNREWVATSQGGNVTLALSGVSATASVGTLLVSCALALSGIASAASIGTLTPSASVPLTGITSTASVGTLAPSSDVPLTGISSTGSVGTVTPSGGDAGNVTVPLTGIANTGAVGSVVPSSSVPLTGIQNTGLVGTLAPSASVPLTGIASTASVGTLAPSCEVPLTGIASTGSVGTVVPSGGDAGNVTVPLTGIQNTGAVGTVVPSSSVPLTGISSTGAVGTLTPSGGDVVAPATINYQGDGKKRKKRRNHTYELFEALEQTIRAAVTGEVVPAPTLPAVAAPSLDLSHGYDAALDQLLAAAGEYQDLSRRVVTLRADLQAYEARRTERLLMEDEEEWMMLS